MSIRFVNHFETIEDLVEVLDRDCPNWRRDWKNNPLDAAVGECVIEPSDAHYFDDYRPITDPQGRDEAYEDSLRDRKEWESLGDCEDEFPEADLPDGFQEAEYDPETGKDLWQDPTTAEQVK